MRPACALRDASRDLLSVLQQRGLVAAHTGAAAALRARLASSPAASVYCGFDPTAAALHIGHLPALLSLAHAVRGGLRAIVLLGGATARIGDPSGRSSERPLLAGHVAAAHARALQQSAEAVVRRAAGTAGGQIAVLDNAQWLGQLSAVELVCGIGRFVRVPAMLARDSVRSRLSAADGISYAEFSYQVFQAYDFYHLHKHYNCALQIGGSDQWGNITAGTELIRRMNAPVGSENESATDAASEDEMDAAFGITLPLMTTKSGEKFGKSAGNAVWLSRELTTPYALYQFLLQTEDELVADRLKQLTMLPLQQIEQIVAEHQKDLSSRSGQRALAAEVTRLVHDEEGLREAVVGTELLFGRRPVRELGPEDFNAALPSVPHVELPRTLIDNNATAPLSLADLLVKAGLAASRSMARKLVAGGGVTINDERAHDAGRATTMDDVIAGGYTVLRVGRKQTVVVAWSCHEDDVIARRR